MVKIHSYLGAGNISRDRCEQCSVLSCIWRIAPQWYVNVNYVDTLCDLIYFNSFEI